MNVPATSFRHQARGSNQIPDRELDADWVPVGDLQKLANHPRKLKPSHVRRIARSIEQLGWVNAIIVDEHNAVIAGYGRWEAAKQLGLDDVPVIRVNGLTDAQKRAYRISENKLAERGEWDLDQLAVEFTLLIDNDFEVELTGFDMAEIDTLLAVDGEPGEVVNFPAPDTPPISRRGDVWQIGPHRVMCGDATNGDDYMALLEGEVADIVFSDPPYNVSPAGNFDVR
ncbi:MAG: ParB N-terminal domain-containing protein [Sphingomonas sp.]